MVNQPGCPARRRRNWPPTLALSRGLLRWQEGDFRLFANGTEVITQTGVAGAMQQYSTLRFGYREYHPHDRIVWYDDVATAPDRIGCQ